MIALEVLCGNAPNPLHKQPIRHMPLIQRRPFRPAFVLVDQFHVVQPQRRQERGVEVVDVDAVFHRVQTQIVGAADRLASLHAAAGEPHGEAGGVVVAAVPLFAHGGPAELAPPQDQRVFQEAAGFEIAQQARDGLVGGGEVLAVVGLDVRVGILLAAGAVVELHEPHPPFDEPAGEEAHAAERGGVFIIEAVELLRRLGFFGENP